MPSDSWFCSVLSGAMSACPVIHYDAIGSPLPLLGLSRLRRSASPRLKHLESIACPWGSGGIHRMGADCKAPSRGFVTAEVRGQG